MYREPTRNVHVNTNKHIIHQLHLKRGGIVKRRGRQKFMCVRVVVRGRQRRSSMKRRPQPQRRLKKPRMEWNRSPRDRRRGGDSMRADPPKWRSSSPSVAKLIASQSPCSAVIDSMSASSATSLCNRKVDGPAVSGEEGRGMVSRDRVRRRDRLREGRASVGRGAAWTGRACPRVGLFSSSEDVSASGGPMWMRRIFWGFMVEG